MKKCLVILMDSTIHVVEDVTSYDNAICKLSNDLGMKISPKMICEIDDYNNYLNIVESNRERLLKKNYIDGTVELLKMYREFEYKVGNITDGSNMYIRLCKRYALDEDKRGQQSEIIECMMNEWLDTLNYNA